MSFKNKFNEIFNYIPQHSPDFIIPNSPNNIPPENQVDINIYPEYDKTIEYLTIKYNLLINSDINLREFEITLANRKFKACLLFIDGIVDSDSINESILSPLLLRNSIKMNPSSNPVSKKAPEVKKLDLKDFLLKNIITQNTIKVEKTYEKAFERVNSGFAVLFVETLDSAICIEIKNFKGRTVSTPQNESVIRGPHEAYVENIRVNTSLIRKIINNENLIIENTSVGKVTKTQVAICYMKNIANDDLVSEVKFRINSIKIDSILSSGPLENLIKDNINNPYPESLATERPDRTCNFLLTGRIAIFVNGSPYALIVPAIILDFLTSSEDTNLNYFFANFLKIIRIIALGITLLLPGLYLAITVYHDEFLPSELLFAITSAREKIPFPILLEIFLMEISFELIREAGIRVPSALGQAIGIVGALVLGDAAVTANIVSPILVIIIALTGISEFTLPDFSFSFATRIFRFVYIILGFVGGLFGIACGIFVHLSILFSTKSFGVSILSYTSAISYPMKPVWKIEKNLTSLNTKRPAIAPKTSMPWRHQEK